MEDLYWGAETERTFILKNADGSDYVLSDGDLLYAVIKNEPKPTADRLLRKDISSDYILKLKYEDYVNLDIGKKYWIELVIVKDTGEYLEPLYQKQFFIRGVAYAK